MLRNIHNDGSECTLPIMKGNETDWHQTIKKGTNDKAALTVILTGDGGKEKGEV